MVALDSFVGRSVAWSVGRLIGRSVGGWLAARSLARLLEGGLSSSIVADSPFMISGVELSTESIFYLVHRIAW